MSRVQIYVVNVDTHEIKKVTSDSNPKGDISWSPDGESFIYMEDQIAGTIPVNHGYLATSPLELLGSG